MKLYTYKEINNCIICGSISDNFDMFINNIKDKLPNKSSIQLKEHPKEIERKKKIMRENDLLGIDDLRGVFSSPLRKRNSHKGYENAVIIVSGGCNIGDNIAYINSTLEELNKALVDNNCHILFIRGEKDNPQIFNEEKINFSNVKTIPDYSVIEFKSFKCLCIGGSISTDREWKKEYGKIIGKRIYWDNEGFEYKEDEINDILDKHDIACIITNTSPSFSFPGTNSIANSDWVESDKGILEDSINERKLMDRIYGKFMEKNKKPFVWFYSKYKTAHSVINNDIVFFSILKQDFISFNEIIENNFRINFDSSDTLSYNKNVLESLKETFSKPLPTFDDYEWEVFRDNNNNNNNNNDEMVEEELAMDDEMVQEELTMDEEMVENEIAREEEMVQRVQNEVFNYGF